MKVGRPRGIWPLRPTATASALQLCCWLAAAAFALALATTSSTGAAAGRPVAALPDNPHVLILQRRCIDRIIGLAKGKPEHVVVRQINQQCLAPRPRKASSASGLRLLSCEHPFTVRVIPGAKQITGCLGG